jgi:uncharacterized delta-60 repeat protein
MQRTASAGKFVVLVGVIASVALGAGIALAAPGDLDPSFSGDGRATLNLGGMEDIYWADVAATPDGGSVVVGTTSTTFGQPLTIGIAKLRSDGSFDPAFSGDGKLILSRGIGAYAYAVAAQPDGKIVISGTHDEGGVEYLDVVRVNANGTLDSSFGAGGFRSITFNTPLEEGYDVAVGPDGKIVAAGYAGTYIPQNGNQPAFADYDIVVVRLNSNGVPDTTFSGDGIAKPTSGTSDEAQAVAIQPDGKIVVAGAHSDEMTATRFNSDGTLDSDFGTGGQATPDFPNNPESEAYGIALQPDGNIVLAGYVTKSGKSDVAIARLDPTGALDPTFSDDGEVVSDLGASREQAFSAAIQANGKVVVGGFGGAGSDLVALRFDASGVPDASFGGDGVATVDFASDGDEGGDVAIQADGQILLAGVTDNNDDFAIARLNGDPTGVVLPPPDGDSNPPETTITKEPDSKSHKSKAKYRFESSEPNSTFECAYDSKTYKPCDAGKVKYKKLDFGKHKFSVRATDAAGNTDQSPAKDKFKRKH